MIAAYGAAKFKDGEGHFEVMYKADIEAIRTRSRAKDDGPWITDYDEMARKTVIRRLCKYLPMNPEYQNLVTRDEYHEAGVLGQYIDVDPATGEVIEKETGGSMLDMFATELEEEPVIEDPRFEVKEVDTKEEEEEVEGLFAYEPDPPESDEVAAEPPPAPEGDPEPPTDTFEQGQGRISKQDEAAFATALANLKNRMRKVATDEDIDKLWFNRLGIFGAEKPHEIRIRSEREKFYRELVQMCEQWESLNRKVDND